MSNPFPKELAPGQRIEYIVTSVDMSAAEFITSSGGYKQLQLELTVETDDGPTTRRHWITFNEKYPNIAKDQLKALGWTGSTVSKLEGVGTKQCKLVGTAQKNDPTRVNWNLYPMSRPVTEEQRLSKQGINELDDMFSETKLVAAPVARPAVAARKF